MNKLTTLLLCLLLTACAKPTYIAKACPRATMPPEPHYPIQDLKATDSPAKVSKAYVQTVSMMSHYIKELQIKFGGNDEKK